MVQVLEDTLRIELLRDIPSPELKKGVSVIPDLSAKMLQEAAARVKLYNELVGNFQSEVVAQANAGFLAGIIEAEGVTLTLPERVRNVLKPKEKWEWMSGYLVTAAKLFSGGLAEEMGSCFWEGNVFYISPGVFPTLEEPIQEATTYQSLSNNITLSCFTYDENALNPYYHLGFVDIPLSHLLADTTPPSMIAALLLLEQIRDINESVLEPFSRYAASLTKGSTTQGKTTRAITTTDEKSFKLEATGRFTPNYKEMSGVLVDVMREVQSAASEMREEEGTDMLEDRTVPVYLPSYHRRRVDVLFREGRPYLSEQEFERIVTLIDVRAIGKAKGSKSIAHVIVPGALAELSGKSYLQ